MANVHHICHEEPHSLECAMRFLPPLLLRLGAFGGSSNIHPMSMYATQDEILFKSGVEFDVVDQDKLSDGSYTIKLRQRE